MTTATLVPPRDGPKVVGIPKSGLFTLIGDTKSGKTWFGSSFPKSYVLELEKKRGDRIPFGRIHEVDNFVDFGDVLQLAIAAPDIDTIVIDSVDQLANWIAEDIAKAAGVEFIGKPKQGVDSRALWGEFAIRVRGLVDFLKDSGKLVIFIAHRRVAKEDIEGKVIKPAGINVSGQGGDYIAQQSEIIGYMDARVFNKKTFVYLSFKGESQRAIWRSGIEELQDQEILIRKDAPYESFAELFVKAPAKEATKLVSTNGNGAKSAAKKR